MGGEARGKVKKKKDYRVGAVDDALWKRGVNPLGGGILNLTKRGRAEKSGEGGGGGQTWSG